MKGKYTIFILIILMLFGYSCTDDNQGEPGLNEKKGMFNGLSDKIGSDMNSFNNNNGIESLFRFSYRFDSVYPFEDMFAPEDGFSYEKAAMDYRWNDTIKVWEKDSVNNDSLLVFYYPSQDGEPNDLELTVTKYSDTTFVRYAVDDDQFSSKPEYFSHPDTIQAVILRKNKTLVELDLTASYYGNGETKNMNATLHIPPYTLRVFIESGDYSVDYDAQLKVKTNEMGRILTKKSYKTSNKEDLGRIDGRMRYKNLMVLGDINFAALKKDTSLTLTEKTDTLNLYVFTSSKSYKIADLKLHGKSTEALDTVYIAYADSITEPSNKYHEPIVDVFQEGDDAFELFFEERIGEEIIQMTDLFWEDLPF